MNRKIENWMIGKGERGGNDSLCVELSMGSSRTILVRPVWLAVLHGSAQRNKMLKMEG